MHPSPRSTTRHDVEDDSHAPDVSQLRNVRDSHQNLGRSVRVAATVRLTSFILVVHWIQIGTREPEVYHLYVVLKYTVNILSLGLLNAKFISRQRPRDQHENSMLTI